jgi:hypothetical protein
MKQHIPILEFDKNADGFILICRECGKILWWQDNNDECKPPPPTLGINVRDGTGLGEKVG